MGTRPGQLDPGVVLYLLSEKGMSPGDVQNFLYRECGLKGLSGISNDMRELQGNRDPRAAFAVDYFVYRVGLNAGMLAAAMQAARRLRFHGGDWRELRRNCAQASQQSLAWLGASTRRRCERREQASDLEARDSRVSASMSFRLMRR